MQSTLHYMYADVGIHLCHSGVPFLSPINVHLDAQPAGILGYVLRTYGVDLPYSQ